ncbi:tetratricopeptide repeat protein [Gilvimarinus sp. F26214L]|uniref:tetratricopeptide repeat protein n=1 Tax=Gilvimarinus sp. DZF01 TaxID=3461371 RepID=UPI0040463975
MPVKWTLPRVCSADGIRIAAGTTALLLSILLASVSQASDSSDLDARYQQATTAAFYQLGRGNSDFALEDPGMDRLVVRVRAALDSHQPAQGLALAAAHADTVVDNLNHPELPWLLDSLFDSQAIAIAEGLREQAYSRGSNYGLARVRLAFARHYGKQGKWQRAIDELDRIDIANVLAPREGDEAYVLYGVALQGLKQHREAVKYYSRVEPGSDHYRTAQLNTALAFIRQDWWTDAQLAIENALAQSPRADGMRDRLLATLGYSQIQYGFYRDARESFRRVRTDGPYSSRALLGLGVAALHQEDMIGALNAFDYLKDRDANDISALESYLLSAYSLDKLGQTRSASAAYSEAIAFYQRYLGRCQQVLEQTSQAPDAALGTVLSMVSPDHRRALRNLSARVAILEALGAAHIPELEQNLHPLREQYTQLLTERAASAVNERQRVVESYLSQSRFGLAQLYDAR